MDVRLVKEEESLLMYPSCIECNSHGKSVGDISSILRLLNQ